MLFALNVTFVGLFVVFLWLIILSVIIFVFSKSISARRANTEAAPKNTAAGASVLKISEDYKKDAPAEDISGDELITVLTAAVLASMKPGAESNIRVKSFRRIPQGSPAWNVTGRLEHIAGKL